MATSEWKEPKREDLDQFYETICKTPSDINEHLPILKALAERCDHVTEFGVRAGYSTAAFLMGRPKTLVSWDIDLLAILSQQISDIWYVSRGVTNFQPRVGDSLKVEIEPTDLLFIDSRHTGKQLQGELKRHGMKAAKFIVLHDTELFGEVGEDGIEPGLVPVIRWWRRTQAWPLWRVALRLSNNSGLVVLQRETDAEKNGVFTWAGGTKWVGPGGWR